MSPYIFCSEYGIFLRELSFHPIYQIKNYSLQIGPAKTLSFETIYLILGFNIFTTQSVAIASRRESLSLSGKIEEN